MGLTYRDEKDEPLTPEEGDENIRTLADWADNIDIVKSIGHVGGSSAQILAAINNLPLYEVDPSQSVWFRYVSPQSSDLVSPPVLKLYKMIRKGKGSYGQGGTQLATGDILLVYSGLPTVEDVTDDPTNIITPLGPVTGPAEFLTAANSQSRNFLDTSKTYYFSYITGGVSYIVQFIGAPGMYGLGNALQFTLADFTAITNSEVPDGPVMQNYDGTLSVGNTTKNIAIHYNGSISTQFAYYGFDHIEGGVTTSVGFRAATVNGKVYFPANRQGETLATLEDVAAVPKDVPEIFISTSTGNDLLTAQYRQWLTYLINGTPKRFLLKEFSPTYDIALTNEIVRGEGIGKENDFFVLGQWGFVPQELGNSFILGLYGGKLVNNVLLFDRVDIKPILLNRKKLHSLVLHRGFLFTCTRHDDVTTTTKFYKINPYDLTDITVFEFPLTIPYSYTTFYIEAYENFIYMSFSHYVTGLTSICRISENLNSYETVLVIDPSSPFKAIGANFSIHEDRIVIPTTWYTGGVASNNAVGVQIYSLGGTLLQSVGNLTISTGSSLVPIPHWCAVFNNKLIFHTIQNNRLVRVNLDTLAVEDSIALPFGITDDNTIMSDGYVYLNSEGSDNGDLIKVKYNNFSDYTTVISGNYRSTGSIHTVSKNRKTIIEKTSQLKNTGENGADRFATEVYVNAQIAIKAYIADVNSYTNAAVTTLQAYKAYPMPALGKGTLSIDAMYSGSGVAGIKTAAIYFNTTPLLTTGAPVLIASAITGATSLLANLNRIIGIRTGSAVVYAPSANAVLVAGTTPASVVTFDFSVPWYIISAVTMANSADILRQEVFDASYKPHNQG